MIAPAEPPHAPAQRQQHTIASYRDTFRLLLQFARARLRKPPSALVLENLDAPFVNAFLGDLEKKRGASVTTHNLRLTAIRIFFRFVSFEEPARSALIQRVLAIPSKRHDKRQVHFLTRPRSRRYLPCPIARRGSDIAITPCCCSQSRRDSPLRADRPRHVRLGRSGVHR
jgi:hypothetical protein